MGSRLQGIILDGKCEFETNGGTQMGGSERKRSVLTAETKA